MSHLQNKFEKQALENFSERVEELKQYITLQLQLLAGDVIEDGKYGDSLTENLLRKIRSQQSMLPEASLSSPIDQRIESFLREEVLTDWEPHNILPRSVLRLDQPKMARVLSLPPEADEYTSDILKSYRLHNGILHNPKNDRRTTKGVFHVCEGGLPIPNDKKAVPRRTFTALLARALAAPEELTKIPFTGHDETPQHAYVTLLLRPLVCPQVADVVAEKRMEIKFFAPASMASNLDFVETIFGNAGDDTLLENNAALAPENWSGHTGCVILAPHLITFTKKELGLPHISEASARQKRDGMCWEQEDEKYNDGSAFKITARSESGVIVTLIADNYFGYCKKEVKTQISYAANLLGQCEEEHSGGALVFPSYDLGESFQLSDYFPAVDHTFAEFIGAFGDRVHLKDGYAIDKIYDNIYYIPESVFIDLNSQRIEWEDGQLPLAPEITYVLPSGYKIEMRQPSAERRWRLIGYNAEGTLFHKPSTVSGGGKSEISKPITDAMVEASVFIKDFKQDFAKVKELLERDYNDRFIDDKRREHASRPILSSDRSLGSVIKLFTPSELDFTPAYNDWLKTIPSHIVQIIIIIKRFYKPDWGDDWASRFSVDMVNGEEGNELKYKNKKLITQYVRVGYGKDHSWRIFGLRKDFSPSFKLSTEDDITASVVVAKEQLSGLPEAANRSSLKFIKNCENYFFQRPDDAIKRGYDKVTEKDFCGGENFFSNYEPLPQAEAAKQIAETIRFSAYTDPLQQFVKKVSMSAQPAYFCLPSSPRLVDGVPTKNPRYLQRSPEIVEARGQYLAEMGTRMYRRIPQGEAVLRPVDAVLPGRRNNPPEKGVRALCVYNPIHYMELPEFFMEIIASLTGKSPSTTGAGSEGALTKAPFNALPPIYDLNNALAACLVTNYPHFITAAGYVGPNYQVDHDVSLLVPEIWSRMKPFERDPAYLIEHGFLEKCEDFTYEGEVIAASRLGYRITKRFMRYFGGRVFSSPTQVFTEDMLRPELQDEAIFVDGMKNILEAHQWVAQNYFDDDSIEYACPPLKALLHIMAKGDYEGKTLADAEVRELFSPTSFVESAWYEERLKAQQNNDLSLLEKKIKALSGVSVSEKTTETLAHLNAQKKEVASPAYLKKLTGSIGRQPM